MDGHLGGTVLEVLAVGKGREVSVSKTYVASVVIIRLFTSVIPRVLLPRAWSSRPRTGSCT